MDEPMMPNDRFSRAALLHEGRHPRVLVQVFQKHHAVLGGIDERSVRAQEELYAVFPGIDVLRTNNKTAESIKYASNALQATLISFALCEPFFASAW